MEGKDKNINNRFYDDLQGGWYESENHPVALLRAENALRIPWIIKEIGRSMGPKAKVLDIGCGAGFLTNALAQKGYRVTGIDLSLPSLEEAKKRDAGQTVSYLKADALNLPFEAESFDSVCAMDLLEHVEKPDLVIAEAGRVLRPGGLFFFHTFNKNLLSYLLVIKAVELFVPNTPKNMHVYPLFIKPKELKKFCIRSGLENVRFVGCRPKFFSKGIIDLLFKKTISKHFSFVQTKSLLTGYSGSAFKKKVP